MTYYDDLQIQKSATLEEIKKAYKTLSLQYHPDKNVSPDAKDKFLKIQQAYEVLSNLETRQKYDNPPPSPHQFFNNFFANAQQISPSPDIIIRLSFDDFIYGTTVKTRFQPNKKSNCECMGFCGPFRISNPACPKCGGRSIVVENIGSETEIEFVIPPKLPPDIIVKYNTYVIAFMLVDTPNFSLNKTTIIYQHPPISIFQALVGITGCISYGRDKIEFSHPGCIKPFNEQKNEGMLILNGYGLYDSQGNRGALIIVFNIDFPNELTIEQKKLIQTWT